MNAELAMRVRYHSKIGVQIIQMFDLGMLVIVSMIMHQYYNRGHMLFDKGIYQQ